MPDAIEFEYEGRRNSNSAEAESAYSSIIAALELQESDFAAISGQSRIVGAAALVYPDADADTLLAASLWTACLIVNDDRWDYVQEDGGRLAPGEWFDGVTEVVDTWRTAGPLSDPFFELVRTTMFRLEAALGTEAADEIGHEIKRAITAMKWEGVWNEYTKKTSLATYLSFRRGYCTMDVQVVLDKWINGGRSFAALRDDPIRRAIDDVVVRFGCLSNDYYSWGREKKAVDKSNAVRILMDHAGYDESTALAHIRDDCVQAITDLDCIEESIKCSGHLGSHAKELLDYLACHRPLLYAAAIWPTETDRYR
ncbi:hypothetical protein [Streptomyces sp. CNQ085]|uniref:terpentetriene synthase n=1 Tax=Streptomyces sp. CNQ085 TaxID=2886944 RepID=UPI001F5129AD|nr:hypothetical protein [Streptomyces sp. CNQ085]MCI0385732.1 hypothetical protein [Streptomyces sp. CNQ085]